MLIVALVAGFIGAVFHGMRSAVGLKSEIQARQGVVDEIDNELSYSKMWTENLERRIARSARQPSRDPRHEFWTERLALWQTIAAKARRIRPKYERLVWRPWERFPDVRVDGCQRIYADPDTGQPFPPTRAFEAAYLRWSLGWATVAALVIVAVGLGTYRIGRHLIPRRSGRARDLTVSAAAVP
jgi:hypothetical protein